MLITSALVRFLVGPAVIAISDWLFVGVEYGGPAEWVLTGVILAVISLLLDMVLLDTLGKSGAFLFDTAIAALLIYASQFAMRVALVTSLGAVGAGLLFGIGEIFMHRWIQAYRRRQRPRPEA